MAGGTNYSVFSPIIWSDTVRMYFQKKLYAAKFFENWSSQLAAQGGDTIRMPVFTAGETPSALTTTTGDITDPTFSETAVELTVNSWVKSSRKFSDFQLDRMKSNYDLQNRYLRDDIAYQLANNFDQVLVGQNGVSKDIQLHTGTSNVSINNTAILECLRIAESYSMPIEEMAFMVHPNTYYGQLMRRTGVLDAAQFGANTIAVAQGSGPHVVGSLFGRPVYVTGNIGIAQGTGSDGYPVTTRRNLFVHPRCLAYATFGNVRLTTMPVANAFATRVIGDMKYGAVCADKYAGVRLMSIA